MNLSFQHCQWRDVENEELDLFHLHNFANDAVEQAHELRTGQLDLFLQVIYTLVLKSNSQQQSLHKKSLFLKTARLSMEIS